MRTWLACLLFLVIASAKLFPCTCVGPPAAKNMREVAKWYVNQPDIKLIFEGRVIKQEIRSGAVGRPSMAISMTPSPRFRIVDFRVTRTFRGENHDEVSVVTGLGDGDCGYDFRTGSTYLVYASAGPGKIWFTSICTGTAAIEDAGIAIRLLGHEEPAREDLLSPQEYAKRYLEEVLPMRTGSVCGYVMKPDGTPLKGAGVELWELRNDALPSRTADDPDTSTGDGHFCIEHVEPGHYLLTAESGDFDHNARLMAFYPGVGSRGQAATVDIRAGARLRDIKLTVVRQPLYNISIRVITPDGRKLSCTGVTVNSPYHDPLSYHNDHMLDDSGTYTFGYVPAGKYQVATYFERDENGQPCSDESRWKRAQKDSLVNGDTEVVVQVEPLEP